MRSMCLLFGLVLLMVLTGCGSQKVELGTGPVEKEAESVLFAAIGAGKLDIVKQEISRDASLLYQTEGSLIQTPLLKAVRSNQLEIARYLIESGAEVNDSDFFGRTALAVGMDVEASPELLQLLKDYGASD